LIAAGYETTRTQQTTLPSGQKYSWNERILVIRSLCEAKKQFAALQQRIENATKALLALTPEPGRGRRQILGMLSISESIYQTPLSNSNALSAIGRRCGELLAQFSHTFTRVLKGPKI